MLVRILRMQIFFDNSAYYLKPCLIMNLLILIANEYRNWLLYYAAPVLKYFLPVQCFHHFLMLVKGINILLQESIKKNDFRTAEISLKSLVYLMDELYGKLRYFVKTQYSVELRNNNKVGFVTYIKADVIT